MLYIFHCGYHTLLNMPDSASPATTCTLPARRGVASRPTRNVFTSNLVRIDANAVRSISTPMTCASSDSRQYGSCLPPRRGSFVFPQSGGSRSTRAGVWGCGGKGDEMKISEESSRRDKTSTQRRGPVYSRGLTRGVLDGIMY